METNSALTGRIAEIELSYKSRVAPKDRAQIHSSSDSYKHFLSCWDQNKIELQEQFKVFLMNQSLQILGVIEIGMGAINGVVVDKRLIFGAALKSLATKMIVAHNHPSGTLRPSDADIRLTHDIAEVGKLLDITLLDHLIITAHGYYSFADEGRL